MKNEKKRRINHGGHGGEDKKSNQNSVKLQADQRSAVLHGIYSYAFLFSLLIFSACHDPFTLSQPTTIPAGKGSFSLSVAVARTILPGIPTEFASYTLDFQPSSGSVVRKERSPADIGEPVYLEPGTYTLVVTAYLDGGKPAVRGSVEGLVINEGENTSQEIILRAIVDEGNGTFTYDVSFPTGLAMAGVTIAEMDETNPLHEKNFLSGGGGTTTYTETVPLDTGYYDVVFTFEKADSQTLIWRELLHIYSNLESVFSKYFTDDDFCQTMHTVTFMDGSTELFELRQNNVLHGGTADEPVEPTKDGHTFGGWYSDPDFSAEYHFNTPVISDITLYAKWIEIPHDDVDFGPGAVISGIFYVPVVDTWPESISWDGAITAITNGGPGNYIINVIADFDIPGSTASTTTFGGTTGIKVSLRGEGADTVRTVGLSSQGSLIRLWANQTVILRDLTLQGYSVVNNAPVVSLATANSAFTMQSGKITGNTFNTGNEAGGGGVQVDGGIFTMNDGEISGNKASNDGGGVSVYSGTFTMNGGTISGNISNRMGGGVYVMTGGTFTMHGGEISGNNANNGGGVYVGNITFTMHGGTISGNTATTFGGGVSVASGTFTMHGGTISGNNNTGTNGGGVYVVGNSGTFQIINGTIYGSNEAETSLRNTANSGAALYVASNSTVQHGRFDGTGGAWKEVGNLTTRDTTIRVVNGELIADDDDPDFPGEPIGGTFTVSSLAEWNAAIEKIKAGGNDKNYTINVTGDFTVPASSPTFGTTTNITVSLRGSGTLAQSSNGYMIHAAADQTLILRNLTLQGRSTNTNSVVRVDGVFVMYSGTISGNTSSASGGGVYVATLGTFTMHSGTISGNTANSSSGGGVMVNGGTFTMEGGEISGNTSATGGGVRVSSGTFTMNGGKIFGNTVPNGSGGGVYVDSSFIMQGGEIFGNTAGGSGTNSGGGGVYVASGTFQIVTGTIYGSNETTTSLRNIANSGSGATLYMYSGTAQRGTFNGAGGAWISSGADLATTNNTINVLNGGIVP